MDKYKETIAEHNVLGSQNVPKKFFANYPSIMQAWIQPHQSMWWVVMLFISLSPEVVGLPEKSHLKNKQKSNDVSSKAKMKQRKRN